MRQSSAADRVIRRGRRFWTGEPGSGGIFRGLLVGNGSVGVRLSRAQRCGPRSETSSGPL